MIFNVISRNALFSSLTPLVVFLVGLCLSIIAGVELRQQTLKEAEYDFQRRVERVHGEVMRRFRLPVYGLNGAKGMYAASERISRANFRAYVESRNLKKEFPGVRGFGFIARVMRPELDSFINEERRDGAPGFELHQLAEKDRSDLLIIKIIEPTANNVGALGLDIGSESSRRLAAETAIDSGEATMTGPVTLVQDYKKTPGVLILVPVYLNGTFPKNKEERRAALRGLVYSPIVVAELLHDIKDVSPDSIDFELIDTAPVAGTSATIYDYDGHTLSLIEVQHAAEGRRFFVTLPINVLGRELILQVSSASGFDKAISFQQAWLVFIGLLTINGLFTLILYQQINRKRRAEALAKEMTAKIELEEARASDFSRSASDWFWETDNNHRFCYFSENFASAYGVSPDRFLGKSRLEILEWMSQRGAPISREELDHHVAQLHGQTPFKNFEYPIVLDNGDRRWISVSGVPFFADGAFSGYRGTGTVITERKNAEAEIRTRENKIRAIIETTVDGIVVIDANGLVQTMNPAAVKIFGYALEEVQGRNVSMLMPEPYANEHDGYLHKYFATGERKIIGIGREVRGKRKDGTTFAMELAVNEMEANGARMFTGVVRDITDRKKIEESLLAAKKAAEEANRAKSSFLATMSHEIRTPMNGILGMLQLLVRTSLTTRQRDYVIKAEGATKALLAIINDILDFSKVEAGKFELSLEPMSIDGVMRDLAVILSATVGDKNVEVLFDLDADIPSSLVGDSLRLRQVLLNLAGNAVKFTERGEIVVTVRQVQREVGAVALEFSVRDTGIGIRDDKLNHIFDPFSQAESSTARRFGGTGLGLAICHRLVDMMGGALAVESEFGKGSRFFFTLQFAVSADSPKEDSGPDHTSVKANEFNGGVARLDANLMVLAVEDHPLAGGFLQKMAESLGWQMHCVTSGEAALEHLQQQNSPRYHIVFLDWRLPGIDGWETASKMRRIDSAAKLPIVLMAPAAGCVPSDDLSTGQIDLVDGLLIKPITTGALHDSAVEAIATREGGVVPHRASLSGGNLQGLRLLVVDDNRLNQQVAKELLEGCGATVSIAGGGREAVDMALGANPPFDAILMDVQMPDMDGLEATRLVREDRRMAEVPIIAMTANAMESDQDACRAVGMVDHVAKPIELASLIATILRHLGERPTGEVSPTLETTTVVGIGKSPAGVADDLVDVEAAIKRLGGNSDLYQSLVDIYRIDGEAALAQLQGHIRLKEWTLGKLRAHTLKGLSATVGAMAVARLAGDIETMVARISQEITSQDETALSQATISLGQQFRRALDLLPKTPPMAQEPEPSPQRLATEDDCKLLAQGLSELSHSLMSRDMRATKQFAVLLKHVETVIHVPDLRAQLDDLGAALQQLDFSKALALCSRVEQGLKNR